MINEKIAKLINEQVNKELYSGYLYLDFANYYADEGLDGFAHWYEIQAQEERDHALMMQIPHRQRRQSHLWRNRKTRQKV